MKNNLNYNVTSFEDFLKKCSDEEIRGEKDVFCNQEVKHEKRRIELSHVLDMHLTDYDEDFDHDHANSVRWERGVERSRSAMGIRRSYEGVAGSVDKFLNRTIFTHSFLDECSFIFSGMKGVFLKKLCPVRSLAVLVIFTFAFGSFLVVGFLKKEGVDEKNRTSVFDTYKFNIKTALGAESKEVKVTDKMMAEYIVNNRLDKMSDGEEIFVSEKDILGEVQVQVQERIREKKKTFINRFIEFLEL